MPNRMRRGEARERIVRVAADLMHLRGVAATSIDEILEASATGKSQLYHYFENKDALIHEVLQYQLDRYIDAQKPFIDHLDTWKGIRTWLEALASQFAKRQLLGGCPIGSLASEMADRDEKLRKETAAAFDSWESYLAEGLALLQSRGGLRRGVDVVEIAEVTMSFIQGGYLLANTKKDIRPMKRSLDAAYVYLRTLR